jgi:hypothetical protein
MKLSNYFQLFNDASMRATMARILSKLFWGVLLMLGVQSAGAFALIGPVALDPWQIPQNGFNPLQRDPLPIGPKNLGEEYRRNTPFLFYTFDQNFLDYFGSNGVYAINQAVAQFNSVTNLDGYSADLSEWPLESKRFNFQAQTLQLFDLKSETMHMLTEQIGLTDPERYIWVLHNRGRVGVPNPPPCPDGMQYQVVKRNFDPVPSDLFDFATSSYVNDVLYTYQIIEGCTGPPPLADAIEFPVDPEATAFTSVAGENLELGGFYTSLTRDEIGGMRYLYSTNNMNFESISPDAQQFVTNDLAQLLISSNLTLLAAQALTNNAGALAALFPGLIITDTTNIFTVVATTNITPFFTNPPPWAPAGTPPQLAFSTNVTFSPRVLFRHTFANLVTFQFIGGQWVVVPIADITSLTSHRLIVSQTITVAATNAPWTPAGSTNLIVVTNTITKLRSTNDVTGEFFILPPGLCDVKILGTLLTNVIASTNFTGAATNGLGNTNVSQLLSFTQQTIDFSTNHAFIVQFVNCQPTNAATFQGMDHLRFVRHDFDSLINRFFEPVTNVYTLTELTNGMLFTRTIERIILQPDMLFSAADLGGGPSDNEPITFSSLARNVNFNSNNRNLPLAGPGTIEIATTITFNKVGAYIDNRRFGGFFLDEGSGVPIPFSIWGSFDGTTNPPVVYPNGTSIANLANQVLMPISPNSLPNGQVGSAYSAQFSTTGGQPPYTWTLAPGSDPLPPGLGLSSGGALTGTATQAGTFAFAVRLTDGTGRNADHGYAVRINP